MTRRTWFDSLTTAEAARINKAFREKGYSFNAWEDRQEELEAAYEPLPTMKWADRTDYAFTTEANLKAWVSWCATADILGMLHYPTITEVEKNCVALVGALVAVEENCGAYRGESLITALPQEPSPKATLQEKIRSYLLG
jgi:hypothetical protein